MIDQQGIIDQVLRNCDISDARFAGTYTVCGLFLRLRDLYKWENRLDPWVERDSTEILDWIDTRERRWEALKEGELRELRISGGRYDPFDVEGINAALAPHELFYGGGYARSMKPTFFLSELEETRDANGHGVHLLGRELARDLFATPALVQNDCIVIRREAAARYIWDQIFYIRKSSRPALSFALGELGLDLGAPDQIHRQLEGIVATETDRYMYHELGEISDTVFDRSIWREVVAAYPHSPVELLARAVKDLLADTNEYGPLRFIIGEQRSVSLAFHVAFLDGLARQLCPEILSAFEEFMRSRHWAEIERAVSTGYSTARRCAESICAIYAEGRQRRGREWAKEEIGRRLLDPLGI